jgi:geranylgeranyl diphosphate synthase type II
MQTITDYQNIISNHFKALSIVKEPKNLYDPIQYILGLGGKRIRPMLTLMIADILGSDVNKALPAATAVEVFHNFSLIHDDIMDEAPLRRGNQTVHEKWDLNTGILSGDAMLILAYQFFEHYEPKIFQQLAKLFSKTALEVCEGQQYDVDFETRDDVTIPEYLKMIEYKTAVLVGAAMKMGAIVAEANEEQANLVYDFGLNLGIAFQLQDDYLDAFGDPMTFGKQVGGDIIENKKTYLYLMAMQYSDEEVKNQLFHLFSLKPNDPTEKIELVKNIFRNSSADEMTKKAIQNYTQKAMDTLEAMQIAENKKQILKAFGENLMNRTV